MYILVDHIAASFQDNRSPDTRLSNRVVERKNNEKMSGVQILGNFRDEKLHTMKF